MARPQFIQVIEAIGLRAPMFARYRDARGMDDISLNITRPQPARKPEAVAASLISDDNALDLASSPGRLHCANDAKA